MIVFRYACRVVDASDFGVDDGIVDTQVLACPLRHEVAERVAVAETRSHWPFST
jgi:hypothetical protein